MSQNSSTPGGDERTDPLEEAIASASGDQPVREQWEESDIQALEPKDGEAAAGDTGTAQSADSEIAEPEKESLQDELEQLLGRLTVRDDEQEDPFNPPADDNSDKESQQYMDPQLAMELEGLAPPAWLGTRWRDITPEHQREAWLGLRRWVDWLVAEYQLPKGVVPPCWYRHPEIVAELYAAMNMEYKTWEEGAPSVNPLMMWHPHLNAMTTRLRATVEKLGGCAGGSHREPEPRKLAYDEDLWRSTVYSHRETREIDRPETSGRPWYIRARIEGPSGAPLADSNVGGIAPVQGPADPTAALTGEKTPGAKTTTVTLEANNVPAGTQVIWEKSSDPKGPWAVLPEKETTSAADEAADE